jgi:hypothetical protein
MRSMNRMPWCLGWVLKRRRYYDGSWRRIESYSAR